ncbi:hypothetical protein D3H55_05950 [Bacillus salacetis]|uniref:Uncharacterized protein n=1 Tax=Bacillus salacetis TaxID=2315464 RepID=A0A3A1R3E2_9BACI|nr:hypothetical protein D3H55_05950 [Bacillus salacetis]
MTLKKSKTDLSSWNSEAFFIHEQRLTKRLGQPFSLRVNIETSSSSTLIGAEGVRPPEGLAGQVRPRRRSGGGSPVRPAESRTWSGNHCFICIFIILN